MVKILDIAPGRNPHKDANHFIDFNVEVLKRCKGKKRKWNLEKLPYPYKDYTFDKVYAHTCFEHLDPSLHDLFKEVWRILNYEGTFDMVLPNPLFITKRYLAFFGRIHPLFHKAHKKYLGYTYVIQLLHDIGFYVTEERFRYLPFPNLMAPRIEIKALKVVNEDV